MKSDLAADGSLMAEGPGLPGRVCAGPSSNAVQAPELGPAAAL